MTAREVQRLRTMLTPVTFVAGETIVQQGDPADCIYFLMKAEVTVTVGDRTKQPTRVSTLSPGFGVRRDGD